MKKFNVTITTTFSRQINAETEEQAEEAAFDEMRGELHHISDVLVEEVEEKE